MKPQKTNEVIIGFVKGEREGRNSKNTASIRSFTPYCCVIETTNIARVEPISILYSYSTPIAIRQKVDILEDMGTIRTEPVFVISLKYYSKTSTRHLKVLVDMLIDTYKYYVAEPKRIAELLKFYGQTIGLLEYRE